MRYKEQLKLAHECQGLWYKMFAIEFESYIDNMSFYWGYRLTNEKDLDTLYNHCVNDSFEFDNTYSFSQMLDHTFSDLGIDSSTTEEELKEILANLE